MVAPKNDFLILAQNNLNVPRF